MPSVFEGIEAVRKRLYQFVRQIFMEKTEKRCSFGYRGYLPLLLAAYMGVLASGGADTAYLPVVGPSPLRFRPAFKLNINVVMLPLPAPVKPVAALPVEKAPIQPVTMREPVPTTEQTNATVEPPQPDSVISPQMLLKYFNRSTNGNAAGVSAPLDFTPPHPVEPPSSKAEYSTPPH